MQLSGLKDTDENLRRLDSLVSINPVNFSKYFPKVYSRLSLPATSLIFTNKGGAINEEVSVLESIRSRCEEIQMQAIFDLKNQEKIVAEKYGIDPDSLKQALVENQIKREKYLVELIRAKGYEVEYDLNTRVVSVDYGFGKIYGTAYSVIDAHPDLLNLRDTVDEFGSDKELEKIKSILSITAREGSGFKTGIALSGSFAQREINPNPADYDITEYIDVNAEDLDSGLEVFRNLILENFNTFENHPNIHIVEFKLGRISPITKEGKRTRIFLQWTKKEILQGFKDVPFEGNNIRVNFLDHLKNFGSKDMIKFDLITNISGTFKDCSKIMHLRILGNNGDELLKKRASYSPLQEVYFEDPSSFDIVSGTSNLDIFSSYFIDIFYEASKYSQCSDDGINDYDKCNPLKSAKRVYTFLKTQGRIQEAREISTILNSEFSKLYQVSDSLNLIKKTLGIWENYRDNLISITNISSSLKQTIVDIENDTRLTKYNLTNELNEILKMINGDIFDVEKIKISLSNLNKNMLDIVNTNVYDFLLKNKSYFNVLDNTKKFLSTLPKN